MVRHPDRELGRIRMILHLFSDGIDIVSASTAISNRTIDRLLWLDHHGRRSGPPVFIVASQRRGADSIVTDLGEILT